MVVSEEYMRRGEAGAVVRAHLRRELPSIQQELIEARRMHVRGDVQGAVAALQRAEARLAEVQKIPEVVGKTAAGITKAQRAVADARRVAGGNVLAAIDRLGIAAAALQAGLVAALGKAKEKSAEGLER